MFDREEYVASERSAAAFALARQGDFVAMRYWTACMQLHVVAMLASGLLGATEGNTFAATDGYKGVLEAIAGGREASLAWICEFP